MRRFVFLLILANLLFYAWTHDYLGASRDSESYRITQQLRAEQIRVVSNDLPPPEVARPEKSTRAVEKPQAEVCVVLADMPLAEGESLENLLTEKLPAFKVARTTIPGTSSFWVNMPPQKNKRDAETKAAELKKLGVNINVVRRVSIACYEAEINLVIHSRGGKILLEVDSSLDK